MRRWLHFIFPLLAASAFAYAPERRGFSPGAHQLTASAAHSSGQFVTNRTMPGSLQWNATYNSAGQMLREWCVGSDGSGTRSNSYGYFAAGGSFAGLLQTRTNGIGSVCSYAYDDWLHLTNTDWVVPGIINHYTTAWAYDARGFVTGITERGNDFAYNLKEHSIARSYDAYGQLTGESVSLDGASLSSASQAWDAAGRRTALGLGIGYGFGWRADGRLASASINQLGVASYSYDSAGVLTNRLAGNRATTIASRDGTGRPLAITTKVNTVTKLTETLGWTGDGLLSTHTLAREDFTDSRSYSYANLSRRLTEERLNLDATKLWTNLFAFDNGTAAGPGVLTRVAATPSSPQWNGATDAFSRVRNETNTVSRRSANGRVNGPATVTALLDGVPQMVTLNRSTDAAWTNQWRATLELAPGTHQLNVSAAHPSGQFTTNKTSWFTNNGAYDAAQATYDARGMMTLRLWTNSAGQWTRRQEFYWDPKERLHTMVEYDAQYNGYIWTTDFDGLGRRLRTRYFTMTNAITHTVNPAGYVETLSYYDPMVEFLELGVTVKTAVGALGETTWKLYGPDASGLYGGMQGMGGLDAVSAGTGQFTPVIADARGNILGSLNSQLSAINWLPSRPTGYGAVPGYRPVPLGHGADVVQASAWRGVWSDVSGLYWRGKRGYDPVGGRWTSFDPVWNERDPSYYTFAGGDPINYFDADGRLAKGFAGGYIKGDFYQGGNFDKEDGQLLGQIGAGITPVWGQISDYRDTVAAVNALRSDGLGWGTAIGLGLSAVAWVPGVGDAVKGIGKSILRSFDDVPVSAITPPVNVLPSSGSTFIVSPGGDAIIVPRGASGPVPIVNQGGQTTGFGFTGGSGGLGLDPRVSNVRIMDATLPRGPSPGYPAGYVNYQNIGGQSVNPFSGQTIAPNNSLWHIPLTPP